MSDNKCKYAPVRIKNPTSDNHVVVLHPNQEFILLCSKGKEKPQVEIVSEYVYLEEEMLNGSVWTFKFAQFFDLTPWSDVSRTYLGDIMVSLDGKIVSLSLVLESKNRDVITVVNPMGSQIKVGIDQMVEVVLFDAKMPVGEMWKHTVIIGGHSLRYAKVCSDLIDPDIYQVKVSTPAVLPRCLGKAKYMEDHIWFKLDKFSLSVCDSLASGEFNAGKLTFYGVDNIMHSVSLLLCLKKGREKEKDKPSSIVVAGGDRKVRHYPGMVNNHGHVRHVASHPGTTSYTGPNRKLVKLKPKQAVTLESGAKVVSLEDYKGEDNTVQVYGCEDFIMD